jgi:hypothetical protein
MTEPSIDTVSTKAPCRAAPPAARDAGLDLIRRANRWLIVGAVALTGGVSLAAAHAFHGRTPHAGAAPAASTSPVAASGSSQQPQSSASDGGGGLRAPTQSSSASSTSVESDGLRGS